MEDFDDDFGELYADVEVHGTSAADDVPDFARLYIEPEEDDGSDDTRSQDAKLREDFVSDAMKVDAECGESTHSGGQVSESNDDKEANDDYIGSDSEDDLNILLNDEDCPRFPVGAVWNEGVVRGVGYDEDDSDEAVGLTEGSNLVRNGKCGDQLADGAELVSSNGLEVHTRSGLKGGYKSQFFHHKYVRRGSALVNNMKVNKSMGLVSYPSPYTKGGRNGNSSIQKQLSSSSRIAHVCAAANPMVVQCGYQSYLPWHWSIFDVNIDTLEEKPWRTLGVDITDYFNFGFDENSWKNYCASLEQLWEASTQTGSAVNGSSKINLDATREQTEQSVSGSLPSLSMPKGRAIQVEESMFERQPSMDIRRPRFRDSDVVIQIKVLESSDGYSGSGNSNVQELCEVGEFGAGNNVNIPSSLSKHDNEVSQELLEDVKNSEDSSTEERKDPVSGVGKKEHQDQMEKRSEDSAEASEDELKAEEACTTDQCLIESQLSFGDHDLSLTSYSDSGSENSVHADNEIRHNQRRQLEKSATDLKESASSDRKILKNSNFNRKPENMDYYSRKSGPIRREWRPLNHSHDPHSKLHKFSKKYDAFSKPVSDARELSLLDTEFLNYRRKNVQLQDYGGHKRRDVSCCGETEQSYHYDDEKVVDDMAHAVHARSWYGEDHDSFREHTNRDFRRDWDERDCLFEHRTVKKDHDDCEQGWYHADGGYSAGELSPLSYRESRKFMSRRCSSPARERNIQRRRKHEKPYLRDRNSDKDNWFDECGLDFIDKSYTTSIEREVELLDSKYEHQFIERKRSVRKARHHFRPSLELNSLWSGRIEDKCQEYACHQTSNLPYCRQFYPDSQKNYVYQTGVSESIRGHERHRPARDGRGSDWYRKNIDASNDGDFMIYPSKGCELGSRRYSSPSEVLDWIEDDVILRHHDTFHADEEALSYEETSWHKGTRARYESLHDEMEIDDIQFQHDYLHMPRRDSDNYVKRGYKITCSDKRGQAKCWNTIDFVKGDGKFHGRSSRTRSLMCSGRIENLGQGISKKRTTSMGLYKSHNEKAPEFESSHSGRKRLHSIPDKEHKSLEAEEGQMVTEEPCVVPSMNKRDLSEGEALTGCEKKRMPPNENNSELDSNIGGFDNQRLLATLAKMEKRRERFKEPIALKKEEKSMKPDDNLVVGTDETKHLRPLRKRRWGGN
ncbi:FIP1[V]-like protein isoform X2 [Neltuma alba]|uniref:FIP1[V]-like protein isoform X2 n=1 Tax=Neltuma alba TaxID=207710 RepID=UPI0010A56533|nr:FIP1[V]-like protein isoform X2 [Prosopis alba]XP_028760151.1 FIP1[V]-like protein isoform X2 [Prosopis alba]